MCSRPQPKPSFSRRSTLAAPPRRKRTGACAGAGYQHDIGATARDGDRARLDADVHVAAVTALRDARRAEIDSDLWEFEHDPELRRRAAALHILARMTLGMPDDVSWRVANAPAVSRPARIIVLTTATALTLAAFWVYEASRPQPLPLPPGPMAFVAAPPPHLRRRLRLNGRNRHPARHALPV